MPQDLRIVDLFERPIDRRIEEVIKVDQDDEKTVHGELSEYVVTDSIRDNFIKVLERYRESPNVPHEGIAIWISGFFGSGKSSFAKILGYVLEGRSVLGESATELFLERAMDPKVTTLAKTINEKIPTRAVILDMATDLGVKSGSEKITEVMYKAFLRRFGYSDDLDLADLEIALEQADKLGEFERRYEERYNKPWEANRDLIAFSISEASSVLHEMDPETYPSADSWARAKRNADITPNTFATRAAKLVERRAPGCSLVFVVDEAGQYVGRSTDKMLDLQGVVEAFGKVGRGRAWIAVTSQERLDEVVSSLDGTRVEFAKLRDRFPVEVDLRPEDISEVASKRVLTKKAAHEDFLRDLYESHKGALVTHTVLRGMVRTAELDATRFVRMYPLLPYQIDLLIDVISGLRTQGEAMRQVSGSNRTIIKLAQQLIIHPEVNLGAQQVGALVTLDMVYDLVRGNIGQERQLYMAEIQKAFGRTAWETKAAKAICLLQFVRGLPRTSENVAAVLYPAAGAPPVVKDVEQALGVLQKAQKARLAEDGWELLTEEGKKWEVERQGIPLAGRELAVLRKTLMDQTLKGVSAYSYRGLRNFAADVYVNGERVAAGKEGDVALHLRLPAEDRDRDKEAAAAREESRLDKDALYWLAYVSDASYGVMTELHRSATMVSRHGREKLSAEQGRLLTEERSREETLKVEATVRVRTDLLGGTVYFQGVEKRVSDYGEAMEAVVHGLLAQAVPRLYDKFDLAAVSVKGTEAEALITNSNLTGLPSLCYEGQGRLGLVTQQGGAYAVNPNAPCAREVFELIQKSGSDTGKGLETHFRRKPYGWSFDVLTLITASLFRAGFLEITFQGQKVRNTRDPGAKEVFATAPAFRAAGFAPRQSGLTLDVMVQAAKAFKDLFGREAPLEEGGLAAAIREALTAERDELAPLEARLEAASLPGAELVRDLAATMKGISGSASDDAIRTFAQEAGRLKDALRQARAMRSALTDEIVKLIGLAHVAVTRGWPAVRERRPDDATVAAAAERLAANLESELWPEKLPTIAQDLKATHTAYTALYREAWAARAVAYQRAIEQVRSFAGFEGLPEMTQQQILAPLASRCGGDRRPETIKDPIYDPSLAQLESDLKAAGALLQEAVSRCVEETTPRPVTKVSARGFFPAAVSGEAELDHGLDAFGQKCRKLLQEGRTVIIE